MIRVDLKHLHTLNTERCDSLASPGNGDIDADAPRPLELPSQPWAQGALLPCWNGPPAILVGESARCSPAVRGPGFGRRTLAPGAGVGHGQRFESLSY